MKIRYIIFSVAFLLLIELFYGYFNSIKQRPAVEKKPNEWFFRQRAFPFEQINHDAYIKALVQSDEMRLNAKNMRNESKWELAGPVNTGGRITDVEMHASDMNTIYLVLPQVVYLNQLTRVQIGKLFLMKP